MCIAYNKEIPSLRMYLEAHLLQKAPIVIPHSNLRLETPKCPSE